MKLRVKEKIYHKLHIEYRNIGGKKNARKKNRLKERM
jgi:hypothetical protein